MRRAFAALAFCVFALAVVNAQQPQQPTFRGGVDVIAVDVHAIDGAGRPVPDLKPDEFAITVDGKPRTIVTADYVAHGVNSAATTAAREKPRLLFSSNFAATPSAPSRTIVIVVDHENIAAGSGRAAIDAIGSFLDRLQPNDRVGLMLLTRGNLVIEPTTDRGAIRKALPGIVGHYVRADAGTFYVLGQVEAFAFEHDRNQWDQVLNRECYSRYAESDPRRPACVKELETYARNTIADSRRRQVDSLRSLVVLFDGLAPVPGPKSVLLVSQQLPVAPFLAERVDFNAEARPLAQAAARARVSAYVLQLDASDLYLDRRMPPDSSHADDDMASFGLETVTSVTGGRRMMVSGKPEGAFDRIALEISGYYLLGLRSEPADRDGKPHEIKVAVKRQGVEVRTRQTFSYAADDFAGDKSPADLVNRLLRAQDTEGGIPMSVATYSLVEPSSRVPQMRVLITAEIDRAATKEVPLTVGYSLTDTAGKNAGANVELVTLKPAIGHPGGALAYTVAALVPPGRYTLRLAAADASLRAGSVVHSFEARPSPAGGAQLSDLVVFDPYVVEPGKPRPSVSATVGGQLACYLEAYPGTGKAPEQVSARLEIAETLDGEPRASAPLDIQSPDNTGRTPLNGLLPLGGLTDGDYVVRAVILSAGTPIGRVARPVHVVAQATHAAPAAGPGASQTPAPAPAVAKHSAPAGTLDEVLARLAQYIRDYAEQLSMVIATEKYTQWLQRYDSPRPIAQQLVSEFALVRNRTDWEGYRDVYEVDGKPVRDRQDRMQKLFTESPENALEQGRRIAAESSRYNLGAMQRNFNVPTVALFFLTSENQKRFRFKKDGEDTVSGVAVWKLKYEETQKPTIIRTAQGKDMPLKGQAWVDPVDGRVVKTQMEVSSEAKLTASYGNMSNEPDGFGDLQARANRRTSNIDDRRVNTTASITVTYQVDPALGFLVPAEMLETYEAPYVSRFSDQEGRAKITCRATYADFKRFQTSGRLVPPK